MKNNTYEFLKPTLPKLAITILLVYFFVPILKIVIINPMLTNYECTLYECGDQLPKCFETLVGSTTTIIFPNLFLGIIVGYLFSCILVKIGNWFLTKTPHQ